MGILEDTSVAATLSGIDRLAKGDGFRDSDLRSEPGFPQNGGLWVNKPNTSCCGFDSFQHRRRASTRCHARFFAFLSIAQGSLMEIETQVMIAERLGYVETETEKTLLDSAAEISRLLSGLRNALNKKLNQITA
jgi:hypothetical protein